ncbi:dnaj domain protein cwf23 [Ophiostoma piceae UAMH 11346]|uniref:Dnaj domain protein cwf23 n=1 Tax=Ophiostoma piceae (strain UAMH 11346) TaxID=1262450 RepID=S3CU02_OPHP1|nr:dnaj domain protein cwf23 [Ophiostoma piceae UAMH 11346]
MDDKAELVAFARESAKSGIDLYDLLGVDGTTSRDDIHRAWRRKGLKYHPDKAGDNYDPTIYERFMHARDVLVDDDVRKVYDTGRTAEAQRKMASEQMSSERRRFKDELEAAEKAQGTSTHLTPFGAPSTTSAPESSEHDKLREAGRRRAEERTRREQEAKDIARQREDDRILEIERRLRDKVEKAQRRADKKRSDEPAPVAAAATTAAAAASIPAQASASAKPPPTNVEAEWKRLVQKGSAKVDGGDKPAVDRNAKLFAETMARLAAAGRAQRQREKDAAAGTRAPAAARAPASSTPAAPPSTASTEGSLAAPNSRATELRTTVEPVSDIGDNNSVVELFEPQWEAVDDPEVSQFIKRVPKFDSAASTTSGDIPMETVG